MGTSLRGVLFCLLALLFPVRSFASSDWLPISAEELKMTSIAQQPGAAAVVLYYEENDDDLKSMQSIYTRIKVFTEAGKKYADVEIPYNKDLLKIKSLKGRTIQPDGTIANFEGKPFDRVLLKGSGLKWRVKVFTMPGVQVGSIVEYRYERDYDHDTLLAPEWNLQGELYRVKQHFCFKPYLMDRTVSWTSVTPAATVPRDHSGKVEYTLNDTPPFIEEEDMPPANLLRYNVQFYYLRRQLSAEAYWKDRGQFWNQQVDDFLRKRGGLADAVQATVSTTDTQEQKARKIYTYVQSLQNLTYTSERSGEEMKTLRLKYAEGVGDVLRQKMGYAGDLARLYVAMAREAGLDAYVMRVATRSQRVFDEHYLDFSQLDHEIAVVKLGSEEVRLDPGVRYCPFGLLYWTHAYTRGIRQSAQKEAELVVVEGTKYSDAWLRRNATLVVNPEGQLEGSVQVIYEGEQALTHRVENWNTDEAGKKKVLEDELKRWLPENSEVNLTNKPEWESDGRLVAEFKVTASGVSSAGHRSLLPLDIFQVNRPPRFPHAERTWPIDFAFPFRATDHFLLTMPSGLKVESIPAAVDVKLPYAVYSMHSAVGGNSVETMRDLVMGGTVFRQDHYAEVKSFYDKVKAGDDLQAVFKGEARGTDN